VVTRRYRNQPRSTNFATRWWCRTA
jgi:hypothetical protein